MQKRSPNVATAHSMMTSAGRELELGAGVAHQLLELGLAAALGGGAAERAGGRRGRGGHDCTPGRADAGRPSMPSIFSEKARRQAWHSHAPWPSSDGSEVLVAAVGAVEGHRALGHLDRLQRALAAERLLVGAGDPGGEGLAVVAVGEVAP